MMELSRRHVLGAGLAALPLLTLRSPHVLAAAAAPESIGGQTLFEDWRRMFGQPDGSIFAWWSSGTMSCHVDGLREFPIVNTHAVTICRSSGAQGEATVEWRTIGYYSDLDTGIATARWDNAFSSMREVLPRRFELGPGKYSVANSSGDVALSMTETNARVTRTTLTGVLSEGHVTLTQNEGKIEGFPRADGTLPPASAPDTTELQTRYQFIAPAEALASGKGGVPARGFFSHVYDALPAWLGFGDRLGSAFSKGVMRKAGAAEIVDHAAWTELKQLFPSAFAGNRLKL